jgi:hypothetical protein
MNSLSEAIERWSNQTMSHSSDGRRGLINLCKLVRVIGYKDRQYFGQLDSDCSIGDLINFLEDNSGCIEAIKEWIGNQDIDEWKENLELEFEEDESEEEEETDEIIQRNMGYRGR